MACIVCSGKLIQKWMGEEEGDLYCEQCGLLYEFDPDLKDIENLGSGKLTVRQIIQLLQKIREESV